MVRQSSKFQIYGFWLDLVSERMIKYTVAGVTDWRAHIRPLIHCIYAK